MSSTSVPNDKMVRLKPRVDAATLARVKALRALWNCGRHHGEMSAAVCQAVEIAAGRRPPLSPEEREVLDVLLRSHAEHAEPSSLSPTGRMVYLRVDAATRELIQALAVLWTRHLFEVRTAVCWAVEIAAGRRAPLTAAQRELLDQLLDGWAEDRQTRRAATDGGH